MRGIPGELEPGRRRGAAAVVRSVQRGGEGGGERRTVRGSGGIIPGDSTSGLPPRVSLTLHPLPPVSLLCGAFWLRQLYNAQLSG